MRILSRRNVASVDLVNVAIGMGSLCVALNYASSEANSKNATATKPPRALNSNFIADAIEASMPAVVNIKMEVRNGFASGQSSGSGFLITSDGLIVTNAHVVAHAKEGNPITITMNDGSKHLGAVHSRDQLSDIALVQISPMTEQRFPIVEFGNC